MAELLSVCTSPAQKIYNNNEENSISLEETQLMALK